jgi:hypothetical protein
MAGGYNLQTYKDLFLSIILERNQERVSDASMPDAEIFRRINQAVLRIQKTHRIFIQTNTDIPVVAGVSDAYDFPPNRLNRSIESVRIKLTGDERDRPLAFISNIEMRRMFDLGSTANDSGDPQYVCLSNAQPNKFIIRPVPTRAGTLRIDHPVQPEGLWRIFDETRLPTGVRATFVADSRVVTLQLNASQNPIFPPGETTGFGKIRIGDEIGYVDEAQGDGVSSSGLYPSPTIWNAIQIPGQNEDGSPNALSIILAFPYQGYSTSGSKFISAQVSELEFSAPGCMNMAPVWVALHDYFHRTSPEYANECMETANLLLGDTMPDDPDQVSHNSDRPQETFDHYSGHGYGRAWARGFHHGGW